MARSSRSPLLYAGGVLLAVALVAVPVLGADSSASPSSDPSSSPGTEPSAAASTEVSPSPSVAASAEATASAEPTAAPSRAPQVVPAPPPDAEPDRVAPSEGGNPDKPGKPDKAAKEPAVPVTLRGVVGRVEGPRGPTFTLTVGGTVYEISAGPPWWWGEGNPLAAHVGATVTIAGEQRGDDVDVGTVNGTALRAEGKPPWAGGWKVVGEKHPGWAAWKVEKLTRAGHGKAFAPGQLKKAADTA